jgi:SAM-dependent methyltransferase
VSMLRELKGKLRNSSLFWKYRHVLDPKWVGSYSDEVHEPRLAETARLLSELKVDSVFDFGCATGPLLSYLSSHRKNMFLLGYDISAPAIDEAQKRLGQAARDNGHWIKLYKQLDVSIFSSDLQSIQHKKIGAAVYDRVLLYLSDRNLHKHFDEFAGFFERILIEDFYGTQQGDYRHRPYEEILRSHGFKVERQEPSPYSLVGMQRNNPKRVLFVAHR